MDLFLAHFADTLDQDAHAVMMCDGAGWHDERALTVPDNVTLALLPVPPIYLIRGASRTPTGPPALVMAPSSL